MADDEREGMSRQQQMMADDSDAAILARIADGDAEAVGLLYDRYGARVYTVAVCVTNDCGSAEEITQDIFAWLCSNAQRYDARRGQLAPWLARVTRNRAIDWLRGRRGSSQQREVPLADIPPPDENSDIAADIQRRLDITAALSGLPPEQREVIELTFWMGLSPKEIAERNGYPLQTVYTRLRLGMEKLRGKLRNGES